MHNLLAILGENISQGLLRRTVTKCSRWAEMYRVMGQPYPGAFSFAHHPWARAMHDSEAEMIVGQKAAQMAYTETALNKVFYNIDVLGTSCLYVLPASNPDATDFSTSRFDPALEASPHLATLFSDVKNIGHKRAGTANLYVRGSRSKSQLKSIPVGFVVLDEVDEMVQENIPLVFERMSGQVKKQSILISTPTIENYGINGYYRQSTQSHFFFKCPHCSKLTELVYPDCIVITGERFDDPRIRDTHLICKECRHRLEHADKPHWLKDGIWVPSTDSAVEGFYINQLYSMTVPPDNIAKSHFRALLNPADEQELYNSKLGMCHAVEGAKVTDVQITEAKGSYKRVSGVESNDLITMGVDVGRVLHVEITKYKFDKRYQGSDINLLTEAYVLADLKLKEFEELDILIQQYGVYFTVIDANPERRKALEFARRHWGKVKLCFYGNGITGKNIHVHSDEEHTITVDRTSWLDLSLGRFKNKTITLPYDISLEYQSHIKAPTRIYEKGTDGNIIGRYVCGNEDDHFAHSRNYCELALPFAGSMANCQNIGDVL